MSSGKISNKDRIYNIASLSVSGLCKETGIDDWVLFGGGKIQLSARSDEFDVNILAVALTKGKVDRKISRNILVPLGALGIIRPRTTIIKNRLDKLYKGIGGSENKRMVITIKNLANVPIIPGNVLASEKTLNSLAPLKDAPYVELDITYKNNTYKCYVSCFEVFRFYYGSSNGLLNACLMDGSAEDLIFNPNAEKMVAFKNYVQLRKNLYDVDALPAARIRFDEYAKVEFEKIKHLTKIAGQNDEKWISCRPPTNQKNITWEVSGRLLNSGLILATNIYSCSSKLPFKDLIFGRDNDGRTDGNEKKTYYEDKLRPNKDEDNKDDKKNVTTSAKMSHFTG